MTTPPVEQLWYQTILEEDCQGIRELLKPKKNLWLLKIGWKSDPNRLVGGSKWKGRTALHVAARRGDASLVKQILKLCGLKVDEEKTVDEEGSGPSSSSEGRQSEYSDQGQRAEIPVENSGHKAQGERDGDKRKGKGVDIPPSIEGGKIEEIASSEGYLKSKQDSIQALESALNNYKAYLEHRAGPDRCSSQNNRDDINISDEEFKELLLSKDGRFGLDVLAMAMLNGNVLIVALLVYGLGHCADPPYGIPGSDSISFKWSRIYVDQSVNPELPAQALDGKCSAQRALLRAVTKGVIEEFYSLEPAFMEACLTLYRTHLDFNFLPEEEYLFHFSWTGRFEEVFHEQHKYDFRKKFWERIKDQICEEEPEKQEKGEEQKKPAQEIDEVVLHFQAASSDPSELTKPLLGTKEEEQKKQEEQKQLWRFLLKLHDGQGRTPLHVAVDEGTEKSLLDLLGWRYSYGEDVDAISCALIARDGLGNTSIHRAAGITGKESGRGRFWNSICEFTSEKCKQEVSLAFCAESKHPIVSYCTQSTQRKDSMWFNLSELSEANGFRPGDCRSTPLQTSIIHNSFDIGVGLFTVWSEAAWEMLYRFQLKPSSVSTAELDTDTVVVSKGAPSLASIFHSTRYTRSGIGASFTVGLEAARRMLNYFAVKPSSRSTAALDKDSAADSEKTIALDVMELICVVGADIEWVRLLLWGGYMEKEEEIIVKGLLRSTLRFLANCGETQDSRCNSRSSSRPTLHFLATYGNYETLKLFVESSKCDPFVEDEEENTGLHCLVGDGFDKENAFDTHNSAPEERTHVNTYCAGFKTHLLDYISCKQLLTKGVRKVERKISDENFFADRKNCVNLLLQAGCDMFKFNKNQEPPRPHGRLSSNAEFLDWWYEKRMEEFEAAQDALNNAANAISVTATLFATAAYVGPLQPPRGYTIDNQVESDNAVVATWVFFNNSSFYLSVGAIICSLIAFLPVPKQAMSDELRRRGRLVEFAITCLNPSIFLFYLAFATSSLAVILVPSKITPSAGWNLTLATLVIGGFSILIVAVLLQDYIDRIFVELPGLSFRRFVYHLTNILSGSPKDKREVKKKA